MADNQNAINRRLAKGPKIEGAIRNECFSKVKGVTRGQLGSFILNGRRFIVCPPMGDEERDDPAMPSVGTLLLEGQQCRIVEQLHQLPNGHRDPVEILTARELQIATLVAHGQCTKRIAYQLHISEWTVQTHLRRVYAKLGVAGRAEMVFRCARRLGERG